MLNYNAKNSVKSLSWMVFGLVSLLGIMAFPAQALAAPSPIVAVPFSPDDNLNNPALRMPAAALPADRLGAPRLQALALGTVDTVAKATADKLAAMAPTSIDGETALGLLDAYKMFKTPGYLTAAKAVGDNLKTYVYPGQKLQAPDLVFFNYLSKVTGDDTYKVKGAERLTQLIALPAAGGLGYDTGAKLFNFYNNPTPSDLKQNVHWQVAYWAEAGYLYGKTTWAGEIIDAMIAVQGNPGGFYFDYASKYVKTSGQAKALQVMAQFKKYPEQTSRGVAYLKSLQITSGAVYWASQDNGGIGGVNIITPWDAVVVQDQAVAAVGLAANLANQDVSGIQNAVTYLITAPWYNGAGGFVDPASGEQPGSNSEAIQAMFMAAKVGDLNGDGLIHSSDAYEALKYSIGLVLPTTGSAVAGGDRDCSGQYSAGDALTILKNSAGRFNEVVCQ